MNAFQTLHLYATTWEFSGFLFRSLRLAGLSNDFSRQCLVFTFMAIMAVTYARLFHSVNARQPSMKNVLTAFYAVSLSYLLITPTLHPWYALYLCAFLPFAPGPCGLTLSWSVLLGYYILVPYKISGLWEESGLIPAMIFCAPVSAFFAKRFLKNHHLVKNKAIE